MDEEVGSVQQIFGRDETKKWFHVLFGDQHTIGGVTTSFHRQSASSAFTYHCSFIGKYLDKIEISPSSLFFQPGGVGIDLEKEAEWADPKHGGKDPKPLLYENSPDGGEFLAAQPVPRCGAFCYLAVVARPSNLKD